MNFISSSLLVTSSTEMTTESLKCLKNTMTTNWVRWQCLSSGCVLTKGGGKWHLRAWPHLVFHPKVSVPRLPATPSSGEAGSVAVMGPSRTCQQERDGLSTLTRWPGKTWGCTRPRAGSNLGCGWAEQR